MGDTDALRDKIAQAIHTETCLADTASCAGPSDHDYDIADAVLPVVKAHQEAAQALSLLRSRVEALRAQRARMEEAFEEWEAQPNLYSPDFAARYLRKILNENMEIGS